MAVGIVSLAYLHAVSVWVLYVIKRNPNYTIAGVLAWAIGYVYAELQSPTESITTRFDATSINGVAYAAIAVSIIITAQIIVRFAMYVFQRYNKKYANVVEQVEKEGDEDEGDVAAADENDEEADDQADENV